nr:hypothetical protein KitaXyl93_27970 [Kitasatospora sp. Xyl93]
MPAQTDSWGWVPNGMAVGRGEAQGANRELVYTTRGVDQFCSTGGEVEEPRKALSPGSAMKSKPTYRMAIMVVGRDWDFGRLRNKIDFG